MLTEYEAGTISIDEGTNLVQGFGTRWLTYIDVNDTINIKDNVYTIIEVQTSNKLLIDRLYEHPSVVEEYYTITKTYALLDFTTSNTLDAIEIIAGGVDKAIFGPSLPNPTNVIISTIAEQSDDDINLIVTDGTLEISCSYVDTITVTLSSYGYEDYTFVIYANENISIDLSTVSIISNDVGVFVYDYIPLDLGTVGVTMFDVLITDNIIVITSVGIYYTLLEPLIRVGDQSSQVDTMTVTSTTNDNEIGLYVNIDTETVATTMNEVLVGSFIDIATSEALTTLYDITLNEAEGINIDMGTIDISMFNTDTIIVSLDSVLITNNDVTIIGT